MFYGPMMNGMGGFGRSSGFGGKGGGMGSGMGGGLMGGGYGRPMGGMMGGGMGGGMQLGGGGWNGSNFAGPQQRMQQAQSQFGQQNPMNRFGPYQPAQQSPFGQQGRQMFGNQMMQNQNAFGQMQANQANTQPQPQMQQGSQPMFARNMMSQFRGGF